jgi:hypothetical protein
MKTVILTSKPINMPGIAGGRPSYPIEDVILPSDYDDSRLISWDLMTSVDKHYSRYGSYGKYSLFFLSIGNFNTQDAIPLAYIRNIQTHFKNRTSPLNVNKNGKITGRGEVYSYPNLKNCYYRITIRYNVPTSTPAPARQSLQSPAPARQSLQSPAPQSAPSPPISAQSDNIQVTDKIYGDWLYIKYPTSFHLTGYTIKSAANNKPSSFKVCGSSDSLTWYEIPQASKTGIQYNTNNEYTLTLSEPNATAYNYYAFIIQETIHRNGALAVRIDKITMTGKTLSSSS